MFLCVCVLPYSEKVLRLKPVLDEHVTVIKNLADSVEVYTPTHLSKSKWLLSLLRPLTEPTQTRTENIFSKQTQLSIWESQNPSPLWLWRHLQLDFWSPESEKQVSIDIDVDLRVHAQYLDLMYTTLEQSGMEYE